MAEAPFKNTPSLGVLLRLAHQQFSSGVDEALAEAGFDDIRPHHASVFTYVSDEGVPVSELAEKARVRKQSMAQTVEELETLGYVARLPHPTDKRARLVVLTDRGTKIRPLAMTSGKRIEEEWLQLVGPDDLKTTRSTLEKILASLVIENKVAK
ncbi:MarR family winged helix-turn-helix transcriptional regulator [Rhizobium sp. Root1203]|uniref:MarR family winged helix-turn-helix transcriptional regulator n=1 Tax=Rhizobium sp. Root1203 TaxID=1736427 RepID=UPI0009ECB04A|nr:MarR family winged helix-turn-helix transcriptional regulator [Rhizobium sp. Root1203]